MNLAAGAAAAAVLVWVGSSILVGGESVPVAAPPTATPAPVEVDTTPTARPERRTNNLRGYALSIPEVDGMPPDLEAGSELEVWVAWDPPLTKQPQIEPLVARVIYERTIPSVVPGGPPTAVILVPEGKVDELMYGDRYGALGVALLTP